MGVYLLEGDMPRLLGCFFLLLVVHGASLALFDAFDLVGDLCLVLVYGLVVVSVDRR